MKTQTLTAKSEKAIRHPLMARANGEKKNHCRLPGESVRWLEHQKKVALAIVRLCAGIVRRDHSIERPR